MTQVRTVLVATTAAAPSGGDSACCNALLPLAARCSLDYLLDAIKGCTRLLPFNDKLAVVGTGQHRAQLLAWAAAAGLPDTCIIGAGDCADGLDVLQGLSAAIMACPARFGDCFILAADASYVLEPGSSLSKVVEAAVVRGKDTITATVPFEGAAMLVPVVLEDISAASSRVRHIGAAADAGSDATADGTLSTILGPVCVMRPSTASQAAAAVPAASGGDSSRALGAFLQGQLEQGQGVYAVGLPFFFSVGSPCDHALTDAFFRHYSRLQATAAREVQQLSAVVEGTAAAAAAPSLTIDELVKRLQTLGAGAPPSLSRQQLLASVSPASLLWQTVGTSPGGLVASLCGAGAAGGSSSTPAAGGSPASSSSLKALFAAFFDDWQQEQAAKQQTGARPQHTSGKLPARFERPKGFQMRSKQQHTCYSTSSNAYGAKQPTAFDMPLSWHGIHGQFTQTFHGGCSTPSMTLKTSVERSRVHRELDSL